MAAASPVKRVRVDAGKPAGSSNVHKLHKTDALQRQMHCSGEQANLAKLGLANSICMITSSVLETPNVCAQGQNTLAGTTF